MKGRLMVYRKALRRRLSDCGERRLRKTAYELRSLVEHLCGDVLVQFGKQLQLAATKMDFDNFDVDVSGVFDGSVDDVKKLLRECKIEEAVLRVLKAKWDESFYGTAHFNDEHDAMPFPFENLSDVLEINSCVINEDDDKCKVSLSVNVSLDALVQDCDGDAESKTHEDIAARFLEWVDKVEHGELHIKKLLDRRVSHATGGFEYLVRWARRGKEEECWEPVERLPEDMCRQFDNVQREKKRQRCV